jgi:hypothetical protein
MPLAPDPPFPKTQGDNIRSKDWNDAINELVRLDNAKANRLGAEVFSGPLTINGKVGIGTATPQRMLHVEGNEIHSGGGQAGLSFSDRGAAGFVEAPPNGERWVLFAQGGKANLWSGSTKLSVDLSGRLQISDLTLGPWPANGQYMMFGANTLNQAAAGNYALIQGATGDVGTTYLNSPTSLHLRINNADKAVIDNGGDLTLTGALKAGNSDIYFTQTNHNHTGFGNTAGFAAIENATNYGALMILGRSVTGTGRVVKLWDMLEVNGKFNTTNGPHSVTVGQSTATYGGDGIKGSPNLWLDAAARVILKTGFTTNAMDVAERFPMAEALHAGEVVVYDEAVKAVRRCTQAHDATAVGIVSEEPGFILGVDEAQAPIALCGRVPCWVDADIAPIRAGDLLVTSPTPGHAQKLLDGGHGTGAVIGKALESRASGRGRILAFVLSA